MRVQIPAYTDRWMMGDRYGEVVKTSKRLPEHYNGTDAMFIDIAHVKLDKSGKTMRFPLDDCEVL